MGFRSYVRHFRGAILGLLRPSEAWCFPAGRWFFPWCFPSGNYYYYWLLLLLTTTTTTTTYYDDYYFRGTTTSTTTTTPATTTTRLWCFPEVTLGDFRGAILGLLRPSEALVFLLPAGRYYSCYWLLLLLLVLQKLRTTTFSGCTTTASPSFRGMVFPCRQVIFSMVFSIRELSS